MTKTKIFIILIFLLLSQINFAEQVDLESAQEIATNWFNQYCNENILNSKVISTKTSETNGKKLFYTFFFKSEGFVLVSANDSQIPILAYSKTGNSSSFKKLEKQVFSIFNNMDNSNSRNYLWDQVTANNFNISNRERDVDPLIFSQWGQADDWNGYCPDDPSGPGGNAYAGSGAVSMAMIMKYWNHPANGIGQHSYDHPDYGLISANFGETEYGWTHMPNTFDTGYTQELIFHSGVALNTFYGPNASWATISDAENALESYFQYSQDAELVSKNDYTETEWLELLLAELNDNRPVLYKGNDEFGEHFFIVDGFQNNDYFHINWGNEGVNNGYFYLSALNPGGNNYTLDQSALIGIIPSLGPDTIDENFENGFVNFNWVHGGNADWMIATDEHYYGIFSAKSGAINHNQSSQLMIDIDVFQDGEISFYKKVSCEDNGNNEYDYLAFFIDNVELDRWGGEQNWTQESYPVTTGIHSFKWSYIKDGSLTAGNDCAWIDAIDFPEGGVAVDAPENLVGVIYNENNVELNWDPPSSYIPGNRDLIGYQVFRNDVTISSILNPQVTTYFDQSLMNGVYEYYVKAVYDEGYSDPSNSAILTIEVLYPPTSLSASVEDDDVTLNWNAPAGERNRSLLGYKIIRNSIEIDEIDASNLVYIDADLLIGTYSYNIKAVYDSGISGASNTAVVAIGLPNPPTDLTAEISAGNDVLLHWTAPSGGTDCIGYQVFRNTEMIIESTTPEITEYLNEMLENGYYEYYIIAVYPNENSDPSNIAAIVVDVPYPARNLTAQINNEINIFLDWDIPSTNENRALTGYNIYRNETILASIYNPNITSYQDYDLVNNTYDYYIVAVYGSNIAPPSNVVQEIIEVLYPATELVSEIVGGNNIHLNWNLPVNNGGLNRSFLGYTIFRNDEEYAFINDPQILEFIDSNLANGWYSYYLLAEYSLGTSTPTNTVQEFVEVLYPPENLTYNVTDDDVYLYWDRPINGGERNNSRALLSYKIYKDEVEIAHITDPDSLSWIDYDLINGVYDYYITAIYDTNVSEPSNEIEVIVEVLYPPSSLTSQIIDDINVELSWILPVNSGGLNRSLLGYKVYRNDIEIVQIDNSNILTYTDQNLPNAVYEYKVTAIYDAGESIPSNTVTETIEILYPPTGLTAEVIEDQVTLNWILPVNNGGLNRSFIGYKVYRNDVEIVQIDNSIILTYTDQDLPNDVYEYKVTAIYDTGESTPSNTVTETIEVLYPPSSLTSQIIDNINIELNWVLPANSGGLNRSFLGYKIYRNDVEIAQIDNSTILTYLDQDLPNGVYEYEVTAIYDAGESAPSNTVTETIELLYPPTGLTAEVVEDQVTLNWILPVNSGGLNRSFLGYKVYRDDVEIAQVDNSNILTYTDQYLSNSIYEYKVTAIYDAGESAPSNTITETVEVLYPPSSLTSQIIDDINIELNWVLPVNSGGLNRSFLGYKVYRNDVEIAQIDNSNIQTYTDQDLPNGIYEYEVTAIYDAGESTPSNTVTETIEVLYPPTGLTAEVVEDEVTLNWILPVNNGGLNRNFLGYKVYRDNVEIAQIDNSDILTYTDQDLPNGVYEYKVTAIYDVGESTPSNTVTEIIEVLYPPTGLTASIIGDINIELNWVLPVNSGGLSRSFLGYKVYRDDVEIVQIDNSDILTYTDQDLPNGVYEYNVTAIYDAGESAPSNIVTETIEVLYSPTGLTAFIIGDINIELNWILPVNSGGLNRNFIGYKVYRDDVEIAQIDNSNILTYTDQDLQNGVYEYKITAIYDAGESTPSNNVIETIEILYPPTGLTAEVIEDQVTLNWILPVNSGGLSRSFLGYKVYRDDVEIAQIDNSNILTHTDQNLPNGVYEYKVTAIYGAGESAPSNTVTETIEVLYPPTGLTAFIIGDINIELNWILPVNSGGLNRSFLGYKVYRNDVEIAQIDNSNILTYTDQYLQNGVYEYKITAIYDAGESTPSNTVTETIEILYPPTGLTADVVEDQVTLNWILPVNNGGLNRNFLGYKVYRDNVEIAQIDNSDILTYTDQDLPNGVYEYKVTAIYDVGESTPSNTVTEIIEVLYPPSSLTSQIIDDINVELNWVLPVNSGGLNRSFLGYKVYRDNVEIAQIDNSDILTYTDQDLPNGVYEYNVTAIYDAGESTPSNTVTETIEVLYPPSSLTSQIIDDINIELNWALPLNSGGLNRSFIGYIVYRDDVEIAQIDNSNILTYTDQDLPNGVYEFEVTAIYDAGESTPSNTVTETIEVLYPPTGLTADVVEDQVNLNWTLPVNSGGLSRSFLGYKLYRDDVVIVQIDNSNILTYTDQDLPNGVYEYKVTAIYDAGESAPSNTVTETIEVLYSPSSLTSQIIDDINVELNWVLPVNSGGLSRSFLGYKVYRDNVEIVQIDNSNILTYTDQDLPNGVYEYKITAIYDAGESAPSNTVTETIEVLYPPNGLAASIIEDINIELNWILPVNSGGLSRSFLGYKVYRDDVEIVQIDNSNILTYTDQNLPNGIYEYNVTAIYDAGESAPSNTVTETIEVLYSPSSLTSQIIDDINIELNWVLPVNSGGLNRSFLGYKVYRNDVEITQIDNSNILTYTDQDLPNGVYEYEVTAIYDAGESTSSNTVTETIEVLYPPSSLTSQLIDDINIELNWMLPLNSGGLSRSFLGYKVYRDDIEIVQIDNSNILTYTDQDLPNGVYEYNVTAIYDFGESTPSNTVTETIEVLYPPNSLTSQIINDINIELNWVLPVNSGGLNRSFLGYKVYRNDVEIAQIDNSNILTYTDQDLPNGIYEYKVTAIYDAGESTPSNTVIETIEILYPPSSLTSQIVDDINIELNWVLPLNSGGLNRSFLGYKVYRDDVEIAQIDDSSILTYTDQDLPNGVFEYKVTAIYDAGESTPSNTVTETIEILYPPTGLTASIIGDINIELNWILPVNSGGLSRSFLGYKVYRDDVEIVQIDNSNILTYTDQNLPNGVYEYKVTAIYDVGESTPSNIVTETIEVLYPPTGVTAEAVEDQVNLNWDSLVQSGGIGRNFLGYLIFRDNVLITTISEIETLTYSDENLANGVYTYHLKAIYNSGISESSNTVEAIINVVPDLNPPQNLTGVLINDDSVELTWDIPEPSVFDVLGYKLYRNGTEISEVAADILTYTDVNLENGAYTYFTKAIYGEGLSSNSNSVIVNISVVYPPQNLSALVVNENDVHLTWELPVTVANGFIIFRNDEEIAIIDNPSATEYFDYDLANGNYSYFVICYYDEGISEPSNTAIVSIEVLFPPTELSADVINENDVQLNWIAPENGTVRSLSGYKIFRNNEEIIEINNPATLAYLDEELANDIYDYYVIAVYSSGNSAPSNTVQVEIEILYPTGELSAEIINENDVQLNWIAPENGTTRSLSGYKVFRDNEEIIEINNSATLAYLDEELANGIYDYYVIAVYDSGDSEPSNTVQIEIEVLYPTGELSAVVINENDVQLNWIAPENGTMRSLSGYKIFRDNEEIIEITNPTTLSYLDEELSNGIYEFYVIAVYDSGDSEPSNIVEVMIFVNSVDNFNITTVTRLVGNYPNPFNPRTEIRFHLAEPGKVIMDVFNNKGQKIKILLAEYMETGEWKTEWDGTDENGKPVSSGLYFYRLITEMEVQTKRMILLK